MRVGIKIGPGSWLAKVDHDRPIEGVEVYFDLRQLDAYPPMFAWLRTRGIRAGLHASTPLEGGFFPNLATSVAKVREHSIQLIQHTLDIAAQYGQQYVVIHAGSYRNLRIREGLVELVGPGTAEQEGERWLAESALQLAEYGRRRDVELWVENLPGHEFAAYDPLDRETWVDPIFVPSASLRALGEQGVGLCLDVGHLYAEVMAGGEGEGDHFAQVMDASAYLAPYAHHLHLSTIVPPWNGTDSHNGFLESDYAQGAVPTLEQTMAWLRLFAGRDLWVIPEPAGGAEVHLENYARLCQWVELAEGDQALGARCTS